MSDRDGVPRPYFFLSYAHTPRSAGSPPDPNHWIDRLFRDLCEAVTDLAGIDHDEQAGFMDRGLRLGEGWSERLSEALAHCRVFVPLYSARYFRSELCGKEWAAFSARTQLPVLRAGMPQPLGSAIVPILWTVTPSQNVPPVAAQLQFQSRLYGREYAEEGLYTLCKLSRFRDSYEFAVHRIAQRIVEVAGSTNTMVGPPAKLDALPSAFAPSSPRRRVRVVLAAPTEDSVPAGRSAMYYGPSALDWSPYRPHAKLLGARGRGGGAGLRVPGRSA